MMSWFNLKNSPHRRKILIGWALILVVLLVWKLGGASRAFAVLFFFGIFSHNIFWLEKQFQLEGDSTVEDAARKKYVPHNCKQFFSLKSFSCLLVPGPSIGLYTWHETQNFLLTFSITILATIYSWYRLVGTQCIWFPDENNGHIWFVNEGTRVTFPIQFNLVYQQNSTENQFVGQRNLLAFIICLNIAGFSLGYWFFMGFAPQASDIFKVFIGVALICLGLDQIRWFWKAPIQIWLDEDDMLHFKCGKSDEVHSIDDLQMVLLNDEFMGNSLKGLTIFRFCFSNRIISMYLDSECTADMNNFFMTVCYRLNGSPKAIENHESSKDDLKSH